MGRSAIFYKDRDVVLNDRMVIILFLLIRKANTPKSIINWVDQSLDEWVERSVGGANGLIYIDLSGQWETPNGIREIRRICSNLRDHLAIYGGSIKHSDLESVADLGAMYFNTIDVKYIRDALDLFESLFE